MAKVEEVLEINKILESIKEYCKTERGRNEALSIHPYKDPIALKIEFSYLEEIDKAIHLKGYIPIDFSLNLIPLIDHAVKGGILTINDLDHIASDVLTSLSTYKFLKELPDSFPMLKDIALQFIDISSLEKEIHRVINKSLLIEDKASQELFNIRKHLIKLEKDLSKAINESAIKHKDYLTDISSTIRDGHFVLPVKSNDKHKVKGIIHDVSDTGLTTFIEPEEIVNLNNELVTYKFKEAEEIKRILKGLTNLVVISKDSIIKNNELIAKLDLLRAKILYGNEINGVFPYLQNKINLVSARHPLLNKDTVIPNTFYLDQEKRMLLISGPNAGGKTIVLKTVGILCYMGLCGLMVSAKEATIPFFDNIYIDIGDNQSITNSLSTFSAHISSISSIINKVKMHDLVLIDELGTGTDPKEGEAIALGTIKYLIDKKCLALISSHYSALKEFAINSKNITNGSMLFDEEKLEPTYLFKMGIPGESYALEVAYRYGLNKEVINSARIFLKENTSSIDSESLLKELRKKNIEVERIKDDLKKKEKEIEEEYKRIENEKKMLKEKREHLLENVKEEKEALLEETKEKINDIIHRINDEDVKPHELMNMKHDLDLMKDGLNNEVFNEDININDYVIYPLLGIEGKVISINGKNASISNDGGRIYKVNKDKLHKIEEKKIIKPKIDNKSSYDIALPNVKPELNIIGYHVDEGREALSIYLNACIARNFKSCRIIHGFGMGKLRNMVHEELKKFKYVESFRLGDINEGMGGATIVIFKENKK